MLFPPEIQIALEEKYDNRKGFFRRLFGDHPAVKAVRKLPDADKHNPFKLYRCFNKNNRPAPHQASFQVYQAVLNYFLEYLELTSDKRAAVCLKKLEYLDLALFSAKQTMVSENNLLVGLLHWDTFNRQTLMIKDRHKLIKTAVEYLAEQANGKQYLLVAPEYFYSRPISELSLKESPRIDDSINYSDNFDDWDDFNSLDISYLRFYQDNKRYFPGSIRQVEEAQYKEIVSFLKELSNQHPDLILFPGTISYREAIKQEAYPYIKKRIEENIQYISNATPGEPIVTINHVKLALYLSKSRTHEEKINFLQKFTYIARNTAPCFFQGQQVFTQNKVYNFGEIKEGYPKKLNAINCDEYYPETIFLPGKYQGNIGKINNLSFVIDICADHPRGFLKRSLEQKKNAQPRFHICQSASIPGKLKSQCQAIGGYFIHASAKSEYTSVIKREQEFFYSKETPYLKKKIYMSSGVSTISFFKLPGIAPTLEESIVHYSSRRMSI